MSTVLTDERLPDYRPGSRVRVRKEYPAGPYIVRGTLIGFEFTLSGPVVRVMGEDRLERKIPTPCQVTVDA